LPPNHPLPPLPLSGGRKQATGLDSDECSFILVLFFTPRLPGILDLPDNLTRGSMQLRAYRTSVIVKHLTGGATVNRLWLEELREYWFKMLSVRLQAYLIDRAEPIKDSLNIPKEHPITPSFLPLPPTPSSSSSSSPAPTPLVAKVINAFPALPPVPPTPPLLAMNALMTVADTAAAVSQSQSQSQTPTSSQQQSSEEEDREMNHHQEDGKREEEEMEEEDEEGRGPTDKKLDLMAERFDADVQEFRRLQREIRDMEREMRRRQKLKARVAQRLQQSLQM
jgi:hypothetical protein